MRRNAIFSRAFPDRILTIDFQVAKGDKVVTRSTLHGTHHDDLPDIPATGRKVTITATITERMADGKIAEEWEDWDGLAMMQQLGVIPPPGPKENK
jgi:predicted ester cyclase